MVVQVNIGGVEVTFGEPQSPLRPEPFYPYLMAVDTIQDSTGEETGSTGFNLSLRAQPLIDLNVRRKAKILDDDGEVRFEGVIAAISYDAAIHVRVEA